MSFDDFFKYELDAKKFDKCQGLMALQNECYAFAKFGMPIEFVFLWYNAHICTLASDKSVKLPIFCQRKSGDAATFTGNTYYILCVIASYYAYNIDNIVALLIAGDDSLLIAKSQLFFDESNFYQTFGLEVKMFEYDFMYFCSKFLLVTSNGIILVPDPLKVIVKLGRNDLISEDHIKEYFISVKDNCYMFANYEIQYLVAHAVKERYKLDYIPISAIAFIADVSSDFSKFRELYYLKEGAKLPKNGKLREL